MSTTHDVPPVPTDAAPGASDRVRFRVAPWGLAAGGVGLLALAGSMACGWTVAGAVVAGVGIAACLVATFAAIGRVCTAA